MGKKGSGAQARGRGPLTMQQHRIPAVFMRGGTSKGVILQRRHLPADERKWDGLFLSAMGSPDPNGRQLDGMGGGVSSVSKICVLGPPTRADADVDYTFAQVLIRESHVDYNALCGNMTAAVGPYAADEALVKVSGENAAVRIHNTNTGKIIIARFAMDGGFAAVDGDCEISGVPGSGAPVLLEFADPAGASTGKLLPSGAVAEDLELAEFGKVQVSMIDVSNACVFVKAENIGLRGTELPAEIEGNPRVMALLDDIRLSASVRMGIATDRTAARKKTTIPYVAFVAPPASASTLSGDMLPAAGVDFVARAMSNGQAHRALPLSVSMCLAAASKIEGSVVHGVCRSDRADEALRISMPSGDLRVTADVEQANGEWSVKRGGFYRTQRRLFEGNLLVHAKALA